MKTMMKYTQEKNTRQVWKRMILLAMAFFWIAGAGVSRTNAGCIALDDVPLDVQEQKAPGIVMFLIDDSGSMDWEFSCPEGGDGTFGGYNYLFADPGDNSYSSTSSNGKILEGSSSANKWKGNWSGYNRLYYDPVDTYTPWPTFTNADLNNPKSDPALNYTLNLNTVYHDFGEPLMSTEALVNAGAVFVDNKDTEAGQGLAAEIIMDNVNANNDILWDGRDFGSFSTSGQAWTSATATTDFETNYLSTNTRSRTYTATWSFTNIPTGNYDVYAWWVGGSSFGTAVQYAVNGVDVPTVNQENNGGTWVRIAQNKNFPGSGTVTLTHANPNNNNNRACADAVKIVPLFPASPPVLFEKTGPVSYLGDQGWVLNTDTNAYRRPQDPAPGTYYYTNAVGTFTATWTANNLVPGQLYDVYALWAQGGTNRFNAVPYTTYHSGGTETTLVNQQDDLGDWTKIAGGTNGITFTGGIGKVVLNRTTTSSTSGRACADAVAFVPHGDLSIKIIRAHYYTKNTSDETYLVNLDGGFQYYRYMDDGDDLVESNELVRLTTTQATAAGIVTGRTYTQERQNFANWYSFYRRRELTAKNAISKVINDMQGVYIGLMSIHYGDSDGGILKQAVPVRVTLNQVTQDQSAVLFTTLYGMDSGGGTPLRNGLDRIGKYFQGAYAKPSPLPSTEFASNTYPFFVADKGGSCQQAFTIIMTDGYWNGTYPLSGSGVGNADKNDDGTQIDGFDGPPFADDYSNTLADLAMYYYEHDLNSTLNNDVPINTKDTADHQHLVTYSLSFGVTGSLNREDYPDCPLGACPAPWPDAFDGNPEKIDDLYHAAINGRGKYVNAGSPQEMVDAMNALKQDIESRLGSAAALATNSIQRQEGTLIYQGTYNTAGWFGEVSALPVNLETGVVSDPIWRASEHLPAWGSRKIYSHDGSGGIVFSFNNISSEQEDLLSNNSSDPANPFDPAKVVDFIRGDTSNNTSKGGPFRIRTKPIGDIVHSAPYFYKGVVYIGANDGMLHAIDAATGNEKFCYVPGKVYGHLSDLAIPGYSHRYYVDGTASAAKVGGNDILVCNLGKGGKGVFALNITNPDSMSASKVLWEFPSGTDSDMGYAFSQAFIVNTQAVGQAVIFGNGYDSVSQKAVLYIVNPTTGELIKKLDTLAAGCNGLSTPAGVDVDADGKVDYVFAGDLKGNMWKFDLRGTSTSDWKVYYQAGSTPAPLISVRNKSGIVQSITTAPEVMVDCVQSYLGDGMMVIFGTGRYLNSDDFGNSDIQSFYGIWDWGRLWEKKTTVGTPEFTTMYNVAKTKHMGTLQSNRGLSNVTGTTLLEQTVSSATSHWLTISDNPVDWFNPFVTPNTGQHMGWVFDMPVVGERGVREPTLRAGYAVLLSIIPSSSPCESGGSSVLYIVNACTGGLPDDPQFDTNGDGLINEDDLPYGGKEFDKILYEPLEIPGTPGFFLPTSEADIDFEQAPPIFFGMQYWRIIQ